MPLQRALVRFVNGRAQNDAPKTAPKDALEEKNKGIEDGSVRVEPLASVFDVEQTDSQIKIIDSDGSIYTGTVLVSSTDEKQQAGTDQDFYKYKEANLKAVAQPTAPVTFTASGTNQRLGKIVVINATLLSSEPPAVAYNGVAGDKAPLSREQKLEQLSQSETRTGVLAKGPAVTNGTVTLMGRRTSDVLRAQRIQGTVRFGATNEMRLDATRQSP
jgi:hypothetical protein